MTAAGTGKIQITADLAVEAYDKICSDIRQQPRWRHDSDVDCDYYDGAQTSLEVIQRLKEAGIPPQDSNLIKPTINAVLGLEARSRTDYKVTSDDESQAEIAEGLSARIKEVETESRADRAMSDAYSSMIRAGVGWIEVSREFDPLRYPYRVREVHRNDIYWDWTSREPDLSDARYLRRDKWVDRIQAAQMFPEHSDLMENSWSGWNNVDVYDGSDTGLARSYEVEQTWGRNQDDYLNRNSGMVRLSELWYRHHEDGYVLVLANGKAVEYREDNPYHYAASRARAGTGPEITAFQDARFNLAGAAQTAGCAQSAATHGFSICSFLVLSQGPQPRALRIDTGYAWATGSDHRSGYFAI